MKRFTYLAVALAAIFTSAVSLQADDFAYMGTNIGDFGTIDLTTGAFSMQGNFGQTLAGLVTINSTLYGASYATGTGNLYSINPADGNLTLIGSSGITIDDFGSTAGGGLYAVSTSSNLYSINATNGAATLIGNTGLSLSGFRALSNSGGALYFADGTSIYTLNTATGAATLIGSTAGPGIGALLFLNGTLYGGADSPDIRVDTLNPITGAATSGSAVTGTSGQFYGLAAVPEPATLACATLGGVMLFLLDRRKTKRG
jgi:hypothetical protein